MYISARARQNIIKWFQYQSHILSIYLLRKTHDIESPFRQQKYRTWLPPLVRKRHTSWLWLLITSYSNEIYFTNERVYGLPLKLSRQQIRQLNWNEDHSSKHKHNWSVSQTLQCRNQIRWYRHFGYISGLNFVHELSIFCWNRKKSNSLCWRAELCPRAAPVCYANHERRLKNKLQQNWVCFTQNKTTIDASVW